MLSARHLGDGWQRYAQSDEEPEITGCDAASYDPVGLRFSVGRGFQYTEEPALIDAEIAEFRTRRAARRDFAKGLRMLQQCDSITIDGHVLRLTRIPARSFADDVVLFRVDGSIPATTGAVPFVAWTYVTRWGRHEVVTVLSVVAHLTSDDRRAFKRATVRVGKIATAKAADRLGR